MGKNNKTLKIFLIFLIIATLATIVVGVYKGNKQEKMDQKVSAIYQEKQDKQQKQNEDEQKALEQKMKTVGNGKILKYCPIGDSLTAGFYASTEDKDFVNVLSDLIQSNMGFKVQKVVQTAQYGGLISGALQHTNEIVAQNPDLISIEFGTNDSNTENNVSPDMFKNELNDLIDDVSTKVNHHPLIVLVTTWNKGYIGSRYDNIITSVGKQRNIPVANIEDIWKDKSNIGPKGLKTYSGMRDDFHPNDDGMNKIANEIFNQTKQNIYDRYK